MSEAKGSREKRQRRRGGSLRKHQTIENVVVEESFALMSTSSEQAGDGVYVSATASGNNRLYGVLFDQSALKEATTMWFQDQSDSLELNRRINVLMQQKEAEPPQLNGGEKKRAIATVQRADPLATSAADPAVNNKEESKRGAVEGTKQVGTKSASISGSPKTGESHNMEQNGSEAKRPLEKNHDVDANVKRTKPDVVITSDVNVPNVVSSIQLETEEDAEPSQSERAVQKFKYVPGKKIRSQRGETVDEPGYRVLVATFSSIREAVAGDTAKAKAIEIACEQGGDYLPGDAVYYYQYEVLPSVLTTKDERRVDFDLRTSMGLHSFLHNTPLPPWFPLSNIHTRHGKVLNMLNMKRDNHGNITWENQLDSANSTDAVAATLAGGTRLTMQPRQKRQYQIGVVGGGIAGIACCQELVAAVEKAGIDAHVTLFEARSRFGGRLWTDRSFTTDGDDSIPIELGASWIHGIDDNPLAALAKKAGVEFVTTSEEVQMLGEDRRRIDEKMDERTGQLFDDLLDHAADDCWSAPENIIDSGKQSGESHQAAVRWYSSVFAQNLGAEDSKSQSEKPQVPARIGAPTHRLSSDRSIDAEMGKAIAQHKVREMSKLSKDEHRMLMWNTKNIEYALGANISDLSMKYWDADERHAFEGDHVLLKQGYSRVVDYMMESLRAAGKDKFEAILDFPVGKVKYARKSTSQAYGRDRFGRSRKMVELSDTCSVSSEDGTRTQYFDFLVCACPLGVLKESVQKKTEELPTANLTFEPALPFSKVDAITNVGFGLLDKIYLRFPTAFWRENGLFKENNQCLFGNVSGVNSHHYMFFDIGRCLGSGHNAPAVLMSLVSGQEAVACECLSDKDLVDEVVSTLRTIFSDDSVPEPTSFRFTRWGQDKYSRGSYTFLPPGSTDQDFQLLQSPVNGNGDSVLLEGSETMRLFFAGEHTTALHPSMAHGAMLSGLRAANEVVSALQFKANDEKDIDRVIPVALFRHKNPNAELQCNLCHKIGGQVREGSLIAFKRGARQVLVHNNCAEYSPEVEVVDSKWKNVIKAVNRGKMLSCNLCKENGATIGCSAEKCFRVFHFSCSEDAGWRFDRDGKVFYCDLHRNLAKDYSHRCDRISINYFLTKNRQSALVCSLCTQTEAERMLGQLLAFQLRKSQVCVHEKCIKYTTICDTSEVEDSRMGHEYKNIFRAVNEARLCATCSRAGASIGCTEPSCVKTLHLPCAMKSGWNFEKRGKLFRCRDHRGKKNIFEVNKTSAQDVGQRSSANNGITNATDQNKERNGIPAFLQHNLLAQFGAIPVESRKVHVPGNLDIGGTSYPAKKSATDLSEEADTDDLSDSDDESHTGNQGLEMEKVLDLPLSPIDDGAKRMVRVERSTIREPWMLSLKVESNQGMNMNLVVIAATGTDASSNDLLSARVNDIIVSVNGVAIGAGGEYGTLRDILMKCLEGKTELTMEVISKKGG